MLRLAKSQIKGIFYSLIMSGALRFLIFLALCPPNHMTQRVQPAKHCPDGNQTFTGMKYFKRITTNHHRKECQIAEVDKINAKPDKEGTQSNSIYQEHATVQSIECSNCLHNK